MNQESLLFSNGGQLTFSLMSFSNELVNIRVAECAFVMNLKAVISIFRFFLFSHKAHEMKNQKMKNRIDLGKKKVGQQELECNKDHIPFKCSTLIIF